jgi:hypothetical protein
MLHSPGADTRLPLCRHVSASDGLDDELAILAIVSQPNDETEARLRDVGDPSSEDA